MDQTKRPSDRSTSDDSPDDSVQSAEAPRSEPQAEGHDPASPYDEYVEDEEESPIEVEEQLEAEPAEESSPPPGTVVAAPPATPVPPSKSAASDDEGDSGDQEEGLGGRMTFLEHLDELRRRIVYALLSLVVTFLVAWIFREQVFNFLSMPILDVVEKLVVIRPTEPFTIYLKVSFAAAIFLAAPFILGQVWMFIAPGLYRREKRFALPFLLSSTTLFILGGMFAYYVVLPPALNFLLLEFGKGFQPMITAVEFFDFELIIIVGMGVVFQLPVLVAFLSMFGLVTPRFLWKNFRYAFLIITIIAAVVSPTTDPLNLFLWCGPMVILYTISIAVSWVFKRRRARREMEERF
jgi:sec-independent protein translocase protein TatC